MDPVGRSLASRARLRCCTGVAGMRTRIQRRQGANFDPRDGSPHPRGLRVDAVIADAAERRGGDVPPATSPLLPRLPGDVSWSADRIATNGPTNGGGSGGGGGRARRFAVHRGFPSPTFRMDSSLRSGSSPPAPPPPPLPRVLRRILLPHPLPLRLPASPVAAGSPPRRLFRSRRARRGVRTPSLPPKRIPRECGVANGGRVDIHGAAGGDGGGGGTGAVLVTVTPRAASDNPRRGSGAGVSPLSGASAVYVGAVRLEPSDPAHAL